jgi:hypothetical protein
MLPFLLKGVGCVGVITKGDRAAPRTVTDLERKYGFGKSFSEILGLIDDTRTDVTSVETSLRDEITEQSTTIRRDAEEIVLGATSTMQKNIDGSLTQIISELETKITSSEASLTIKEEIGKGVDKVVTKTGYVFDADGLNISKAGEEMTNQLDNTGMYVKRSGTEVLTANSAGVTAVDLHAKTFLKIGSGEGRCRFEDYGVGRVGCFWTGG